MLKPTLLLLVTGLLVVAGCSSASLNVNVNANANTASANAQPEPTPAAAAAAPQADAARTLVVDLYKAHDGKRSPFFQSKDRSLVDKYFTKSLGDLIWNDAVTSQKNNEVGVIDGDPLYNAQDTDIKNFSIGTAEVTGDAAAVPVTFNNFGKKQTIKFRLKHVGEAWKIDDIEYGGEFGSLRKWFKDSAAAEKDGVFEGKYQVGDTTCTVTPSKMSFEVRWAKGSGVEMFFFRENQTFETSEKDNGRTNRFEFDDDSYNSGTFYRNDGKTFAVKRIG
jgi:hypothetical protein